jgi:hypothetical protein
MKQMAFNQSPSGSGMGYVNGLSLDRQQRTVWTIRTGLQAADNFHQGYTPAIRDLFIIHHRLKKPRC